MENEISAKRNLVLALVIITILVFVGLVWLASAYFPWVAGGLTSPTQTAGAMLFESSCTYPITYWGQHPGMIRGRIVLGQQEYLAEEMLAMLSHENGDLVAALQAQLVGAYLNIQLGAPGELIEATIFQAYGWVVEHPPGIPVAESDQAEGTRLFNLLEAYNLGLAGVPACPDAFTVTQSASSTVPMTASATPTSTHTRTSTPTRTTTLHASATATLPQATPRRTNAPPATREPTSEPVESPVPTTQAAPATPTRTPFVPTSTHTTAPTLTPPPFTPTNPPPP